MPISQRLTAKYEKKTQRRAHLRMLEKHIVAEGNDAVMRGAAVVAIVAFASGISLFTLIGLGVVKGLEFPAATDFLGGAYALLVYALAKRQRIRGWVTYAVAIVAVSIPTCAFGAAEFFLRSGAATYITGPYSYLYFLIVVVTGFFFDVRVTMAATLTAAAGYGVMVALSLRILRTIHTNDPILMQDLSSPAIYTLRAAMLLGTGAAVGALSGVAKRLILRAMAEEQEKHSISHLFGQYVSDEIKDKILREGHLLRGERKQVAILFCDIRGFTTMSEGRSPEVIVETLNGYFDHMVEAIHRNGGVVDKFIGDAVMAVFGGVVDLDNACDSALRSAIQMRLRLKAFNADQLSAGRDTVENGIGIHFGEVLQGNIGSRDRKEFTVIGDAVNIASRLESASKDSGFPVIISSDVYDRLDHGSRRQCHPLDAIVVKGKSNALSVYGVGSFGKSR